MRKLLCPGFCRGTHDHPNTPIETYGYDATGNRTSLLHAGTTTPYTYPTTSHRLTNVGSVTRGYNAVGNTPSTTSIGGTAKEFVYNGNDRMSQVKLAGVVNRSYRYNAKGELVAATNGASGPVAIYILYDEAGHWLGDYDANGATKQQAVWLGESPVGVLAGAGTAQKLHYVQPDHLGTPRTVIDATRNVAIWSWNAKGEAFGNDTPNQDPDQDGTAFVFDLRFPGQRFDAATGLNYNYFRDYDAGAGRYAQSDLIGLRGGLNTFAYANGSPIMATDKSGLATYVITTYNKAVGIEYGSHSALYIDGEHGKDPFLYDPAGHYSTPGASDRPGDGIFSDDLADLQGYIKFHEADGSRVEITRLPTTAINEVVIRSRAAWLGDSRGFTCAKSVSYVMRGYCSNIINQTRLPGNLNAMAENAANACPAKEPSGLINTESQK